MAPVDEAVIAFTSAAINSDGVDTLWKSMLLVAKPIFILPQTYKPSVVSNKYWSLDDAIATSIMLPV
jgi:hypothetical protein